MKFKECYICYEFLNTYKFVHTSCNHFFCEVCCSKILKHMNGNLCPICRNRFKYNLYKNTLFYEEIKKYK